jgi:hypothetical protein
MNGTLQRRLVAVETTLDRIFAVTELTYRSTVTNRQTDSTVFVISISFGRPSGGAMLFFFFKLKARGFLKECPEEQGPSTASNCNLAHVLS